MKANSFCQSIASDVENAVMAVFECQYNDIHQYKDSDVKKVVVFILCWHFGFNKRMVGWNYRITHWYVPTVCEEMKVLYEHDALFKEKIDKVLSKINGYDSKNEMVA